MEPCSSGGEKGRGRAQSAFLVHETVRKAPQPTAQLELTQFCGSGPPRFCRAVTCPLAADPPGMAWLVVR